MQLLIWILLLAAAACFFFDAFAARSTTDRINTPSFLSRIALTPLGLLLLTVAILLGEFGTSVPS